jgi:outer membrane protein
MKTTQVGVDIVFKKFVFSVCASLAVCGIAAAQQPAKIAVIHIQQALIGTKEGQKAATELQSKFQPREKSLEGKQREIQQKQAELSKGSNTMAEAKRVSLTREIDSLTKSLQRESQDAQDEYEQEKNRVLNDLGQRLMVVIDKYAKDNGFALVIDVSSQQTPVLWAANNVNITDEIVALYDKSAATPAPAAPPPAAPKPAAAKP